MEIKPDLKSFKQLAKTHNLIVLAHTFYADWLTPLSVYYALSRKYKDESFLLESIEGEEKICRFSFLGFSPLVTFKSKGKIIYINNRTFETKTNPLDELRQVMNSFKLAPKENLRFFGGFVGYLGYDLVKFFEPIGHDLSDPTKVFDTNLVLPKFLIIFDHLTRQIEILSFVLINHQDKLITIYDQETKILAQLGEYISRPIRLPALSFTPKDVKVKSNFTKHDFIKAVDKAREHITSGDIIQTVLSQRFSVDFNADPFLVYRYLRVLNPSPYMFYLNFGETKLAGASPEMLLRCENQDLVTRPIAGTRKRGANEHDDKRLVQELLNDPKEIAEHIMLVDLARNDLGRVAKKGSVNVPIFMTVEKFSHVMHIVSEVKAKLAINQDIFSALKASFPAGTLSGAPKVRAMQIINNLEKEKRSIYGGCVGYFSFTDALDTCIIIRTILFKDKIAYIQAGAGIVYDSNPKKEYEETLNKAQAQILALKMAVGNKKVAFLKR